MKQKDTLDSRIKNYESEFETSIDNDKHICIRIDGHKFSKFTKGFEKPFDDIISKTMIETTKELVSYFKASVGYTQSDEITLLIPSLKSVLSTKEGSTEQTSKIREDWQHSYNGRAQKLSSLVAAFTTLHFNKYLKKFLKEQKSKNDFNEDELREKKKYWKFIKKNKLDKAFFDARTFSAPNDIEIFNALLWRNKDCIKNSISMFAQSYCSHKSLLGKNGLEKIELVKKETDKDWNDIEDRFKYGVFVKKENYMKTVDSGEKVQRTRLITFSEKLEFSNKNVIKMLSMKL